jgi:Xaa-Pro aminopeptidase
MYKIVISILYIMIITVECKGQKILTPYEQSVWVDSMLENRFESMLPDLMKKADIDMWVMVSREYNEDPIMKTMLPSAWLSARRRTMMVFSYNEREHKVEKIAIARYDVGKLLKGNWNIDVYPDQYDALKDYIIAKNPNKIGLNFSKDFGLADGLIKSEYDALKKYIPVQFHERFISAEKLALAWLETRSPMEVKFYEELCKIGHDILKEIFSRKYIIPGKTNTEEVVWALRKYTRDLGLEVWFHPTVTVQRNEDEKMNMRNFAKRSDAVVIQEGDLLHVDFGITYMRLNTDQQQHFYVLKKGEKEVPNFLSNAFKKSNRLQDILTSQFKEGVTGNELLKSSLDQAKNENIEATIYTHPIGFHGHAAGPAIGMWDMQKGVPGTGDYSLSKNTAYSIELNTASSIQEWGGKIIKIMLEEDGIFDGKQFYYPAGRQLAISKI